MKKLYTVLHAALWSVVGVFIGTGIYDYYAYTSYPDLYAMTSTPWYTGILMRGIVAMLVVAVLGTAMGFVKKKMK